MAVLALGGEARTTRRLREARIAIAFESAGSIPLAIVPGFVGTVVGLVYWEHQQATV